MADVYYPILTAVQTVIQGLNLTGIADDDVRVQWVPTTKIPEDITLPAVLISPTKSETINANVGVVGKDDIGYPVGIYLLDKQNRDVTANLERNLGWRSAVIKAFHEKRLSGVSSILYTRVEPDTIVDIPAFFAQNLWKSSLVLRFYSREART